MTFFRTDAELAGIGDRILADAWEAFPELGKDQIAFTWLVYDDPVPVNTGGALSPDAFWQHAVRGCSYRGDERVYPASVIKLFYLVAAYEWIERGMLQPTPEFQRALRDAIVVSSNDATSLVVDMLTGTTSGPELPPGPFESWKQQRQIVNRYFQNLGWEELAAANIVHKTWNEGAYGRERAFLGEMMENRNMLTTNATMRLLHAIIGGVTVSARAAREMMDLMHRSLDRVELAEDPENQVLGFLGEGIPENSKLWSKAGETSQVRHDAAYIEIPDRAPFALVVFTEGSAQSQNERLLPFLGQQFSEWRSRL